MNVPSAGRASVRPNAPLRPAPRRDLPRMGAALLLAATLVAGCGGAETAPRPDAGTAPPLVDATAVVDAGQAPDAGAAPADSGGAADAAPADSGAPDAGDPVEIARISFALLEDFGGDPVTGVEVCLWDVEDAIEDCQTIDWPEGVTFRAPLGRQVYFRVRGEGYAPTAYPYFVADMEASLEERVLTTGTRDAIVQSGLLESDPTKGLVIAVLDHGGAQDPEMTRRVQIRSDDVDAVARYSRVDVTRGIDPRLSATSTAAGLSAAGLLNVAPGRREVRLEHPADPSCRLRGYPRSAPGAGYPVHVFADTLTQLSGVCEAADRGQKLCSVFDQDCPDAAAACRVRTFIGNQGYNEVGTMCEAPRGQGGLGEVCARPTGEPGHDTCAPGLYCAYWGLPRGQPQARECKLHCDLGHPCGAGQRCKSFGGRVATEGACIDECDPFGAGCGPDLNCTTISTSAELSIRGFTTCQFVGAGAAGDGCSDSEGCGQGLACIFRDGNGTCRQLCQPDAPACPAEAQGCWRIGDLPSNDVGYCL